jgi:hypothetical protein
MTIVKIFSTAWSIDMLWRHQIIHLRIFVFFSWLCRHCHGRSVAIVAAADLETFLGVFLAVFVVFWHFWHFLTFFSERRVHDHVNHRDRAALYKYLDGAGETPVNVKRKTRRELNPEQFGDSNLSTSTKKRSPMRALITPVENVSKARRLEEVTQLKTRLQLHLLERQNEQQQEQLQQQQMPPFIDGQFSVAPPVIVYNQSAQVKKSSRFDMAIHPSQLIQPGIVIPQVIQPSVFIQQQQQHHQQQQQPQSRLDELYQRQKAGELDMRDRSPERRRYDFELRRTRSRSREREYDPRPMARSRSPQLARYSNDLDQAYYHQQQRQQQQQQDQGPRSSRSMEPRRSGPTDYDPLYPTDSPPRSPPRSSAGISATTSARMNQLDIERRWMEQMSSIGQNPEERPRRVSGEWPPRNEPWRSSSQQQDDDRVEQVAAAEAKAEEMRLMEATKQREPQVIDLADSDDDDQMPLNIRAPSPPRLRPKASISWMPPTSSAGGGDVPRSMMDDPWSRNNQEDRPYDSYPPKDHGGQEMYNREMPLRSQKSRSPPPVQSWPDSRY